MAYTRTPQQPIDSGFNWPSTADDVMAGVDLTGKLSILTGGYSGIGLVTTKALAAAGAIVVVPARQQRGVNEWAIDPAQATRLWSVSAD